MPRRAAAGSPASSDSGGDDSRVLDRRRRNCLASQAVRDRHKAALADLAARRERLRGDNAALRRHVTALESEQLRLQAAMTALLVAATGVPAPPAPPAPPGWDGDAAWRSPAPPLALPPLSPLSSPLSWWSPA